MWWKIYYWLSVIFAVVAVFSLVVGTNSFFSILTVADFVLAVLAVHAFIYKKKIFNPTFWLYFFWFNIVYDLTYLVYGLAPNDPLLKNLSFLNTTNQAAPPIFVIIVFLLDIPMLYSMYQLAKPLKK